MWGKKDHTPAVKRWTAIIVPVTVFLALACSVLPYPGIQYDEALFAVPIYSEVAHDLKMRAFHHDIPLMLMTYLGTSKTWLYGLIFSIWRPGVLSLRLPAVLIGAITVAVLFVLLRRVAGRLVALAACLLLATDATYILTTTFDWGPVAIQHLAWAAGVLLVTMAVAGGRPVLLGAGFFMFGLGMWDKAIFAWMLSGTAVAALVLFPHRIRKEFTGRNVLAAVVGFGIGAMPFIVYNIRNPLKTFQGNAVFSTDEIQTKLIVARRALCGSSLFGYLVNEEMTESAKLPRNAFERASVALRDRVGTQREGWMDYAFLVSIASFPLWWPNRRIVLFALIVLAVAWLQMLFTKGAGTGAHHVALLWPLPHIVIGTALAGAFKSRPGPKVAAAAVLTVLCLTNVLVVNQYLSQFIRNGPTNIWTDAILPLSDALIPFEKHHVFAVDWGMDTALRVLHQGRFDTLWTEGEILSHELTPDDRAAVSRGLALPGAIFVTHTPSYELQPGTSKRLIAVAGDLGYRRHLIARINDSNGRPIFEISRFLK